MTLGIASLSFDLLRNFSLAVSTVSSMSFRSLFFSFSLIELTLLLSVTTPYALISSRCSCSSIWNSQIMSLPSCFISRFPINVCISLFFGSGTVYFDEYSSYPSLLT